MGRGASPWTKGSRRGRGGNGKTTGVREVGRASPRAVQGSARFDGSRGHSPHPFFFQRLAGTLAPPGLVFSRWVRRMYRSALTASSMKRKGLAMKSLPPLMVELARLSKSLRLVTKTTGVFL